jgi:predicted ester cyclase
MSIKEFAEKWIKAQEEGIYKGNCDAMEKLDDPNVVYHVMDLSHGSVGWEAHKQHILGIRQMLSDIRQEWKYLTGEGNLFVLSYKMSGRFTGKIPGLPPPNGKEVTSNEICLCRLKKGKIIEAWMYGTTTGLT